MRVLLNAYCTKCDFRRDGVKFGAATEDDTPVVPAIDNDNGQFVAEEVDENNNLSYYHDFGMNRGKEGPDWIETFGVFLSPDHNKCPQCGEYAMRFEPVGEWGE
jgi:hypothetical protein